MTTPLIPSTSRASSPGGTEAIRTHHEDLALVRRILDGDEAAWRYFVERYAGLVLAMSRRYLHTRDVDDMRSVLADVLESLRRARLRRGPRGAIDLADARGPIARRGSPPPPLRARTQAAGARKALAGRAPAVSPLLRRRAAPRRGGRPPGGSGRHVGRRPVRRCHPSHRAPARRSVAEAVVVRPPRPVGGRELGAATRIPRLRA